MENDVKLPRAFIGVQITDAMRKACIQWVSAYRLTFSDETIRWTTPNNLHMTLSFLGKVRTPQFSALLPQLKTIVARQSAFSIQWNKVTYLPFENPYAIVISLSLSPQLQRMVIQINHLLKELGFPFESRPFFPHITLGRLPKCKVKVTDLPANFTAIQEAPIKQRVKHIHLFESHQEQEQPFYIPRVTFFLGETAIS